LQGEFTIRLMWASLQGGGDTWSFLRECLPSTRAFKTSGATIPCNQQPNMRGGVPELMTIDVAYQKVR
jgi:hypothetical protein